jgi:predicted LPLAT superfamily acyltransferase
VSTTAASPEWARRAERGTLFVYRFAAWFALTLGRAPARLLLHPTTAYFLLFNGVARRSSAEYLARCLGRRPTLAERYRHIHAFASTVLDRVFFLRQRFELFALEIHGVEHFGAGGAFLMGAHLGSFEALRAAGREFGGRAVAMAMYEENARKLNGVLLGLAPELKRDIVPLGRLESMLELESRLQDGAFVGVLADRTLAGDTQGSVECDFLGQPARFPLGPMRMAAALRARVIFMTALYHGGNRYELRFEPLADFSGAAGARGERDAAVRQAVRDYVARLERHARSAPENWFNFYPFWDA